MARILIVDDDHDIVEALGVVLTDEGHRPAAAHDRAEAIRLAVATQPEVVLLDYTMPDVDPVALVRELKAIGPCRIILCTGADVNVERIGADALLPKPFSIDQLLRTIELEGPSELGVE